MQEEAFGGLLKGQILGLQQDIFIQKLYSGTLLVFLTAILRTGDSGVGGLWTILGEAPFKYPSQGALM